MASALKLAPLALFGILDSSACAAPVPCAVEHSPTKVELAPRPRTTCEEQARKVQPPPTLRAHEQYLSKCLIEHEFAAYVWERQTCGTDDDCTVVETSCPFGCGAVVASTYAATVSARHDELLAEFNKRAHCMYKCDPVVAASCVQHRCAPRHLIEDKAR